MTDRLTPSPLDPPDRASGAGFADPTPAPPMDLRPVGAEDPAPDPGSPPLPSQDPLPFNPEDPPEVGWVPYVESTPEGLTPLLAESGPGEADEEAEAEADEEGDAAADEADAEANGEQNAASIEESAAESGSDSTAEAPPEPAPEPAPEPSTEQPADPSALPVAPPKKKKLKEPVRRWRRGKKAPPPTRLEVIVDKIDRPLLLLLPTVVFFLWLLQLLPFVDSQEQHIRPMGSLAYATFVQLAHNFSSGLGWEQTVHRGYAPEWRWGGHYTPIFFFTAWLSQFWESAWTLARIQVVIVSLGTFSSALLGWAEGRFWGLIAGLILYAGSAPIILMALADYQDLVLLLPMIPLGFWAARHASPFGFMLVAVLIGTTREEALLLLPFIGFSGGMGPALLGALVMMSYLVIYKLMGAPGYPNPLFDILSGQIERGSVLHADWSSFPWSMHAFLGGPSIPWFSLSPVVALPALPVIVFHGIDPLSVRDLSNPSIHHLAPMVGILTSAAVVGVARICRSDRRVAVITLLLMAGISIVSWYQWQTRLVEAGLRINREDNHLVWTLIEQVPEDEVLLVDQPLVAAVARRRYVITEDSLSDPNVVKRLGGRPIRWAILPAPYAGIGVAQAAGYALFKDPPPPMIESLKAGKTGPP